MDTKDQNFTDLLATLTKAEALANPQMTGIDGREHVLTPVGYTLTDISDPHRLHPRAAGLITVDDRASLVAYSKQHFTGQSVIFADYTAGTISTAIDWHPHNQHDDHGFAGAREHMVQLRLLSSEEFTRWNAVEGKMHTQADFALFLEENASDIHFPEPAIMLELARDLEAVGNQTFTARTRLQNGDNTFAFETENKIVSKVQAPTEFQLMIPVYHGEEPEILTAKFRWRPAATGLSLGFVWHRVEYMRRARFTQIAAAAAEDTGLPIIAGRALPVIGPQAKAY